MSELAARMGMSQWATSPARGTHELKQLSEFRFPPTMPNLTSFRGPAIQNGAHSRGGSGSAIDLQRLHDFTFSPSMNGNDRPRVNGAQSREDSSSGMVSPKRLPPVSLSNNSHRASSPHGGVAVHLHSLSSTNVFRERSLRRSIHQSLDLRGHSRQFSSLDKSSTTASAGSIVSPKPIKPLHLASFNQSAAQSEYEIDPNGEHRERVESWRLTATTVDRGLLRSPLTPRPFNEEELKSRIYGEEESVETAFKAGNDMYSTLFSDENTPRAQQPPIAISNEHPAHNEDPVENEDIDEGTGYAALAMMHRAQEQVRLGVDLPPLSADILRGGSDRVRKGTVEPVGGPARPVLQPSPNSRKREKGDPVKKPTPLNLQRPPIAKLATEDAQTYTTQGLTSVLSKMYAPGMIPSDVIAALPSPRDLSFLSDHTTPTGNIAHSRSALGSNTVQSLEQKDRNYIAYYIDTLLHRNGNLGKEVKRLEEDVEDKEVEMAGLQGVVNQWYAEAQVKGVQLEKLEQFMVHLIGTFVPVKRRGEVKIKADELGVDIRFEEVGEKAGGPVGEEGHGEDDVGGDWRLNEKVKYWKARAEVAERFVGALGLGD